MALDLDHTATLPPELIHRILDGLNFEELQPVLAVCARWRQIALNLPVYWSFVTLKSATDAAVNLFLTRLARSGTRPVTILVYVDGPWSDAAPSIFPALHDHLHHVVSLDITLPLILVHLITGHLNSAAPILAHFRMCAIWTDPKMALAPLPCDLFAYLAPALRSIELENVVLQEAIPVPVFAAVTDVCICFRPWDVPVSNVFIHFPSLLRLRFPHPALIVHGAYVERASWKNVLNLSFDSGRMQHGLLHPSASLDKVPFVCVTRPTAHEMVLLVQQLVPPYRLMCSRTRHDPSDRLVLFFAEAGWRRQRHICDDWKDWNDDSLGLRSALREAIAWNVIYLEVSALCWNAVLSLLPRMETLKTLVFTITGEDDFSALASGGTLCSPALERMAIRLDGGHIVLTAEEVAAFISLSIAEAATHLVLLFLENVELNGFSDYLQGRFAEIHITGTF